MVRIELLNPNHAKPLEFGRKATLPMATLKSTSDIIVPVGLSATVKPQTLLPSQALRFGINTNILDAMVGVEEQRVRSSKQIMSFWEYLDEVKKEPKLYLRSSSQYAVDAIDHFDKLTGAKKTKVMGRELIPHAIFQRPWESKMVSQKLGVMGHEWVLDDIYTHLKENAKKPFPEKISILHGNNSTGKDMILNTLFDGLEQYSQDPKGAMYTFNWVFKDGDNEDDDDFEIAFPVADSGRGGSSRSKKTYPGMIPPDEVGVVIPATMNTNPIFLLNKAAREQLIGELAETRKIDKEFNKDYVLFDKLDTTSQRIFRALFNHYMMAYEDEIPEARKRMRKAFEKVFSHVQVTRFDLSKQNRRGLVEIPALETQDAHSKLITPDIDWNRLPKDVKEAFRTAGIHQMIGPLPQANRGHLFYNDMWKSGNASRYLFLLNTAEKGVTTVPSASTGGGTTSDAVQENMDLTLWGVTNDLNMQQVENSGDYFKSLSERIKFFPVGYLSTYRSAMGIYEPQFKRATQNRLVGPYTLEAFSLWATMTTLFPIPDNDESKKYYEQHDSENKDQSLYKTVQKLSTLQKALLYQGEDPNSYEMDPKQQTFDLRQKKLLERHVEDVASQYRYSFGSDKFLVYEGCTGISPRQEARELISEIARTKTEEPLTIVEVLDVLGDRLKNGLPFIAHRAERLKAMGAKDEETGESPIRSGGGYMGGGGSARWPNYATRNLLFQVRQHYRRRIRYDVQQALKLVNTDEHYEKQLRKYIEHLTAKRTAENTMATEPYLVPMAYRDPPENLHANETFMQEMENIFFSMQGSTTKTPVEERRNILSKISDYEIKYKKDAKANLPIIFEDFVTAMKSHDLTKNRKVVVEFLQDYAKWMEDPDAFQAKRSNPLYQKRVLRLNMALKNLNTAGYDNQVLPKLVHFAYEGTPESEDAKKATLGEPTAT